LGGYAVASSVILYAITSTYYAYPVDQWFYRRYGVDAYPFGMNAFAGDFRNNIWSKEIFAQKGERIAIVGSSFVGSMGNFKVVRPDRSTVFSQTLGMPGNGLMNALRQIDVLARSRSADVIFMGVSPLNFGTTLASGAHEGQCISQNLELAAESVGQTFAPDVELGCFPDEAFEPTRGLSAFDESDFQFKHFVRNAARSLRSRELAAKTLSEARLGAELKRLDEQITEISKKSAPIANPTNGQDSKFKWRERGIEDSLNRDGLGYAALRYARDVTSAANIKLVVYETPTPSHERAPDIFPAGFFEKYQSTMRGALGELGVPYLDMSKLFPWNGAFTTDFVHLTATASVNYREELHKVLLGWLLEPAAIEASGLVENGRMPTTASTR